MKIVASTARVALVSCLVLASGCEAQPSCNVVKRLLVGSKGQRAKYFRADAGVNDVVVYFGRSIESLRPLIVPSGCEIVGAKFHNRAEALPDDVVGFELNIVDEGPTYRVIVRRAHLNLEFKQGVVEQAPTDSERVSK